MEIDWNAVRARFSAMTPDELLEEAALHADDYAPLAQRILEGEALARGITAAQIESRRGTESPAREADGIDMPALITSSDEKGHLQELAKILRERGIPGVIRELDPKAFHGSGLHIGRWGLMVSGHRAADAARFLEPAIPRADEDAAAAGCGGGCCSAGGEVAPPGEEWPEDGDWWKTDPDADDPHEERR